jgi:hypothetical protein
MNPSLFSLNLTLAWLWILLGFVSGMVLGLFFHREDWLGGYGSFRRRMYRLAHISFFGLGAVNLLFRLTVQNLRCDGSLVGVASWAFVVGAITMPLCCVVMACFPKATMIFSVPVLSLLLGGGLMLATLFRQPAEPLIPAVAAVTLRPKAAFDYDSRITDAADQTSQTAWSDSQLLNPF